MTDLRTSMGGLLEKVALRTRPKRWKAAGRRVGPPGGRGAEGGAGGGGSKLGLFEK